MDRHALRRQDYSLSAEQEQLRATFRDFLISHSSMAVVRRAEPLGFDAELWSKSIALGATRMALPADLDGDDAGLVELALIAEEFGRAAAPVSWIDHVAATRTLGRHLNRAASSPVTPELLLATDWDSPVGIDLLGRRSAQGHLISGGAVAETVIAFVAGESAELWRRIEPPPPAAQIGPVPTAWWEPPEHAIVLATGESARYLYARARSEWKLLAAASLLGMAAACLDNTVAFVTSRHTRGVPIGSLQAISHPLANIAVALASGLNLTRRAAWMLEHEPEERPDLVPAAFVFAARTALDSTEFCVHAQGGLGFTTESAASAYFLRARGLIASGGGTATDVLEVVAGLDRIRNQGSAPLAGNATRPADGMGQAHALR